MKDYLKRAYDVDVIKVRSYVEQQKVTRSRPMGKEGQGPLRRPMARKKMTVEMTEPFVWPAEPEDFSPYGVFPSLSLTHLFLPLIWLLTSLA